MGARSSPNGIPNPENGHQGRGKTATESRIHGFPSAQPLVKQCRYREVSTMVGDHMGIPRTVVFFFTDTISRSLDSRDWDGYVYGTF
jgi:hypothetical protein